MAFINKATEMNVKSELDIFSTKPIQTSVDSGSLLAYRPVTPLSNTGPIEFLISGSANDEYLDLARVYLHLRVRINANEKEEEEEEVQGKGDGIAETSQGGTKKKKKVAATVGPVNNWLHSIFSQIDIYLNQKCITPPVHYGYRSYVENLLNYSGESKRSHLTCGIWAKDTAGHMDSIRYGNEGFCYRSKLAPTNKIVDLYGPIHSDLFNIDEHMLSGVEVNIKLQRAKETFHLMGEENIEGNFEIVDAVLYARKVKVQAPVILAHNRVLEMATAKYPLTRVDIKTFTIPANTHSKSIDNIYLGTLPKRCIIGFVDTQAFNGDITMNPYNFQNFDLTQLCFYLDSVAVPSRPFECDFVNERYIRAYHSLFEGTNINHADIGNDIPREDYPNGYTLFAVDMTPDLSASAQHISVAKTGSLRVDVYFGTVLAQSITAVIFAEFDALLEVDKNRCIITDYSS